MGWIVLKNGMTLEGEVFGARTETNGEFVFHTGLSGYQEILTDPSYHRQVVVMTYPEIGNTGINPEDMESGRAWLSGFVVRSLSPVVSNWRATTSLDQWLADQGITGISGIDTRALTLTLRTQGAQMGIITPDKSPDAALKKIKDLPSIDGEDLVAVVRSKAPYDWTQGDWDLQGYHEGTGQGPKIAVWDFGVKNNILRMLARSGARVRVFPSGGSHKELLAWNPDGILLSNGPGDPRAVPDIVREVKAILGAKPILGICFGHQLLGQATGGSIEKLRFGHHGANHPVRDEATGKVEITSQNHNYAVIPSPDVTVSHINLNDKSVEGIYSARYKAQGIQYHPEASPGPWDSHYLFDNFLRAAAGKA